MSLLHLITELFAAQPDWYDEKMRSESDHQPTLEELNEFDLYLEFSDLAYLESEIALIKKLRVMDYLLIRHDVATEPGRVGHFIAVNHDKKEVVIAIKGTSSFSDILTDLVGNAIPHTLDGEKKETVRCHEGIHTAAAMMLDDTQHLIETFFLPAGYEIVICGHSLGAGVSCLLGVFLRSRGIPVRVIAFATPACLSWEAATSCQDYITTVVNNKDCIPRVSLRSLASLMKLFIKIDENLKERGMSPSGWMSQEHT